jgi:hypothetical protein
VACRRRIRKFLTKDRTQSKARIAQTWRRLPVVQFQNFGIHIEVAEPAILRRTGIVISLALRTSS